MFSEFGSECREDSEVVKKPLGTKIPNFNLSTAVFGTDSLEAMRIRQHLRNKSMGDKIPKFGEGGEL